MFHRHTDREDLSGAQISPTVSVVIPTLNESKNIEAVLAALPEVHEVVLVDGRSTDDTVEVALRARPDIRVVSQTGKGKGNALACGFHACSGDMLVMIDADCSTDPGEIPAFVAALVEGADFAKGSRFIGGGGSTDITRLRRAGNTFLNGLVNTMFGTRYTDLCYGYNAMWARHLPVLDLDPGPRADPDHRLWGDGFEIETLINIRIARAGLSISEVPSFEAPRVHGESKLNAGSDGLRVLRTVISEYRRPRPVVPPSVVAEAEAELRRADDAKAQAPVLPRAEEAGTPAPSTLPPQRDAQSTDAHQSNVSQ